MDFPFLANAVTSYAIGELYACTVLDVRARQLALDERTPGSFARVVQASQAVAERLASRRAVA